MGAGASVEELTWEASCLSPAASILIQAIKSKERTCADVVSKALARVHLLEKGSKRLRACVDVQTDRAMARAAEVDARLAGRVTLEDGTVVDAKEVEPGTALANGRTMPADFSSRPGALEGLPIAKSGVAPRREIFDRTSSTRVEGRRSLPRSSSSILTWPTR